MEVATSRWTIDEFQSRFAYVTSQLKRAVDGHCDLKNRARFVSYSLRMVGKTPEQAIPSIVIGCCSSDVSRLQKLFRDSRSRLNCTSGVSSLRFLRKKEDDSFPIFKLIYYPTDSSPLTHKAADELMNVQVLSDQTLCGSMVTYEGRTATISLSLCIGDQIAVLTVAHLFSNPFEENPNPCLDEDEKLCMDESSPIGSPSPSLCWTDDDDQDFQSHGSELSESANTDLMDTNWFERDELLGSESQETQKHGLYQGHRLQAPLELSPSEPFLDYSVALLKPEIMESRTLNFIGPGGGLSNPVLLTKAAESPRNHGAKVFVVSASRGLLTGRILQGFEHFGSYPGQQMCQVWNVVLDSDTGKLTPS